MKVTIDSSGFTGCGLCAQTCPEENSKNLVEEAVENCPVSVIKAKD